MVVARGWACHPAMGGTDQVPWRGRTLGGRRLVGGSSGEFSGAGLFLVITVAMYGFKGKKNIVLAKKILIV